MKRCLLLGPIFLGCTTQIPDYQPMQVAVSSEEHASSNSAVSPDSGPEFWAPTFQGRWSSFENSGKSSSFTQSSLALSSSGLAPSSSVQEAISSSDTPSSSSSDQISSSGQVADSLLDCGDAFEISAGDHVISWELSSCPNSQANLLCQSASGESCGASLTFDQAIFFADVGVLLDLGVHGLVENNGTISSMCDLVCTLE